MSSYRFVRPLGLALTLLCALYFLDSLLAVDLRRLLALPVDGLLLAVAVSIVVYTGLLVGVATGFVHLVRATGHTRASTAEGLIVWGKANLAKYLPGNVLHFAGRQWLGARCGWPQPNIAAASLLEVGLFVLLSALLAALGLAATGDVDLLGSRHWLGLVAVAAALALTLVVCGGRLARRLPPHTARFFARLTLPNPAAVLPAAACFSAFFLGMTLIAWWLYSVVTGTVELAELPLLAGAFLASWLFGFIIPGAPGGIGVREGAFTLLGGLLLLGNESLVIVALAMRVVTLAGEALLFLLAVGMAREPALAARLADGRGRLVPAAAPWPLGVSSRQTDRWRSR